MCHSIQSPLSAQHPATHTQLITGVWSRPAGRPAGRGQWHITTAINHLHSTCAATLAGLASWLCRMSYICLSVWSMTSQFGCHTAAAPPWMTRKHCARSFSRPAICCWAADAGPCQSLSYTHPCCQRNVHCASLAGSGCSSRRLTTTTSSSSSRTRLPIRLHC